MQQTGLNFDRPITSAISPYLEMGAYEALWAQDNASTKSIATKFSGENPPLPSELVDHRTAVDAAEEALKRIRGCGIKQFGVRIHLDGEYPVTLRSAKYAPELIYYQGLWDLIYSTTPIAIVGTRNPSDEGKARTRKLVRSLLDDGATIVSGLAKGIDAEAHTAAIREGSKTVAVLGTPITRSYPNENRVLQREIAENHLLISQVPINRYEMQKNPVQNRHFFPARNIIMSALTSATVIVEAGETSGTLVQAQAAIDQGRKLFILDSCFKNDSLTWPAKFEKLGAVRVRHYDDIRFSLFPKKALKN